MFALLHPVAQVGTSFSVHPSTALGVLAAGALYEWRARQGAREAELLVHRRAGRCSTRRS